jgi:membrane-bound lytic murein transglycosylase B
MRGAWAGELGQTQFLPSSHVKFAVDVDGNGRHGLIKSAPNALASTANHLKGHGWQRGQPWTAGAANFDVLLTWNESQVYFRDCRLFRDQACGGAIGPRVQLASHLASLT